MVGVHKHGLDFRNIPPVRGTNGIDWWIRSLAIKKIVLRWFSLVLVRGDDVQEEAR